MYKKKYGRMTVSAWLNSEMEQSKPIVMILFGVLVFVIGWVVRFSVGAPYRMMLELGIGEIVPPVWLMALLWSMAFFTVGCAIGFVLCYREHGYPGEKYKGCMLAILLIVLEMLWYPIFFSAGLVFFSVLLSFLILCLSVAVTSCFYRVTKFAGMILLLHDIWLLYMVFLNCFVLFQS